MSRSQPSGVRIVDWASAIHDPCDPATAAPKPVATAMPAADQRQWFPAATAFTRTLEALRARGHLAGGGPTLAAILVTDQGDRPSLTDRAATFLDHLDREKRASAELFRAIARFPTGHLLKSICDAAEVRGPAFTVPGGGGLLGLLLASDLILCGRARQALVCFLEPLRDEASDTGGGRSTAALTVLLDGTPCPGRTDDSRFRIRDGFHQSGDASEPWHDLLAILEQPADATRPAVPGLVDLDAAAADDSGLPPFLATVRRLLTRMGEAVPTGDGILFGARRRPCGTTALLIGHEDSSRPPRVPTAASIVVTGVAAFADRRAAADAFERRRGEITPVLQWTLDEFGAGMDCAAFELAAVVAALADAGFGPVSAAGLRVGLIGASFLGSWPAVAFGRARGETALARDLGDQLIRFSDRLGLAGPRVLVSGLMGASMTALALASDLLSLNRADAIVVCGAEILDRAVDASLHLLRCTDRPAMAEGAAAVVLERRAAARRRTAPIRRELVAVELLTPAVRLNRLGRVDPTWRGFTTLSGLSPARVDIAGGTAWDLEVSAELVRQLWAERAHVRAESQPGTADRRLGADTVFRLASTRPEDATSAVVTVSGFGGSGVLVTGPVSPREVRPR